MQIKKNKQQGFGHLGAIIAIIVVIVIGSIGAFVWEKHQNQAHASSIGYKYGHYFQIRDNTKYRRLLTEVYICKWSSNTISVFSIRRGLISHISFMISTSTGPVISSHAYSNWLYNMNLTHFSTVANGHNYMGYASARIFYQAWANNGYGSGFTDLGFHTKYLPACHY